MRRKTIILGMNNPLSDDPRWALFPAPEGCAGYRLWRMLHGRAGTSKGEYARGFDRRNLVPGREWDRLIARELAEGIYEECRGRRVIVLGTAVRDALRLPPVLVKPVVHRGITFRQLPHPSGRCRWYNDPKHRAIAGMVLEEELRR